tara:strand:+ start:2357 stop:3433 length:1077 start_codon:yes stop_codon:yes gene_type:complete
MDGLSAKIDKLSSLKIDRSVSELIRIKKSIGVNAPTARELTRLDKVIQIAALSTDVNPTEEQKRSGNYNKGRFSMKGMTFVLENPKGSVRSGRDAEGNPWSVVMPNHYGYILKTRSDADGDHLDVSIGPDPGSRKVFAIDQQDIDGDFDEHKFFVGFLDKKMARQAYEDSFTDPAPFQGMVELSWDEFKEWIEFGDSSAPIVDQMLRTFNSRIQLMKTLEERDGAIYLYGACMVPNLIDRSKFRDYYDEDDVRKAARNYLVKSRAAGFKHQAIFENGDVQLTQSFIAPSEMQIGKNNIPKGSWVTEFRLIHPEVIRMAKAGELAAFSIGGPSRKWRLEKRDGTAQSRWFGPGGDNANG